MGYSVSWYIPDQVLRIVLENNLTIDELQTIHQDVTGVLASVHNNLHVLIDATQFSASYNSSAQLRDTQLYGNNPRVNGILVIADNKLTRLITLMAFCLYRAPITQFMNYGAADTYLRRIGLAETS